MAVALAVALALDSQRMDMVGQTIQGGAGKEIVVEDLGPLFEGAIAGDDQRAALVAFHNDLVEVLHGLGGERLQAEVVQYQEIAAEDLGQHAAVSACSAGGVEVS